jgi:hypothetical protein
VGNIVFTLDADEGRAVQGFLNLVRSERDAEAGLRRIKDAGKEASDSLEGLGGALVSHVGGKGPRVFQDTEKATLGFGASLTSVLGMVGGAAAVWSAFDAAATAALDRARQGAERLNKAIQDIASGMNVGGINLNLMPQLRAQIEATESATLSTAQKAGLFRTIAQQAGREATPETQMQALKYSARYADTQMGDTQAAGAYGKTYVELAHDALKGMDPSKLADITTRFMDVSKGQGIGEDQARYLKRAMAGGATQQDVLGMILPLMAGAARGGESGKAAQKQLEEAAKQYSYEDVTFREEADPEAQAKAKEIREQRDRLKEQRNAAEARRKVEERGFRDEQLALEEQGAAVKTGKKGYMKPGVGWVPLAGKGEGEERHELKEKHLDLEKREEAARRTYEDEQDTARLQDEKLAKEESRLREKRVHVKTAKGLRAEQMEKMTFSERLRYVQEHPEEGMLAGRNVLREAQWTEFTEAGGALAEKETGAAEAAADPAYYEARKRAQIGAQRATRAETPRNLAFQRLQEERAAEAERKGLIAEAFQNLPGVGVYQRAMDRGTAEALAPEEKKVVDVRVVDKPTPPNPLARPEGGMSKER